MRVLGINATFHDPSAAIVVDGRTVAAAEEERFTRRKHGKEAVPFSAWELPEQAARWCLEQARLEPRDLDVVAYAYDPDLAPTPSADPMADAWEGLRTLYAERAPRFLATALPGLDPGKVRYVPHHVAHAASAYLFAPFGGDCAVLTIDGRGETATHLAGDVTGGALTTLASQQLPDSLGLFYEAVTEHLGFRRASDEYKVMALASYGEPRWIERFRERVAADGAGGFVAPPDVGLPDLLPRRSAGTPLTRDHADLAASAQLRLEEVLLDLATWLERKTGRTRLTMAGGVALNCVANTSLWRSGPFEQIWVQPAAGDAGTALGAAGWAAAEGGDTIEPMTTAALGRGFDGKIESQLRRAGLRYDVPSDLPAAVAEALAAGKLVGWFQGRSEFGPRALGHRSLLADPRDADATQRLNRVKGREEFRPVAPVVRAEDAAWLLREGPLPSPYMVFTHQVAPAWRERIPAAVHVDGSARAQTVTVEDHPRLHATLSAFGECTGVPALINTSFNTAGRPIVDSPVDALECVGAAPIDVLAIGPYLVEQPRR